MRSVSYKMGVAILKSLQMFRGTVKKKKKSVSTMCSVPVTANMISTYCHVIQNCKKTDGICVAWHL